MQSNTFSTPGASGSGPARSYTAPSGSGGGLQMPGQGIALPGRTNGVATPGAGQAGPSQVQPPQAAPSDAADEKASKHTDVDALMDAAAVAGVDLDAEELEMNRANSVGRGYGLNQGYGKTYGVGGSNMQGTYQHPQMDRSRKQDFIESKVLEDIVTRIAGTFQLRSLEPDTIPFLGLAVRHRLANLIEDTIVARNHRIHSHHRRPPPVRPLKRKARDSVDEEYEGAWDQVIYDDVDSQLEDLAQREGDSERAIRRARVDRDAREAEEEKLGLNSSGMNGIEAAGGGIVDAGGAGSAGSSSNVASGGGGDGKDGKSKKEKKKKKEGPGVTARNMSEDARKRLSDKVAAQMLSGTGGKKFAWLSGGAVGSPLGKLGGGGAGSSTANGGTLPKPKFAPTASGAGPSTLPPPTFGPKLAGPSNLTASPEPGPSSANPAPNGIPGVHEASRDGGGDAWATWPAGAAAKGGKGIAGLGEKSLTLRDALFALEKERGGGSGRGSGEKAMWSAHARGRRRD